jgi:acyl dehydratase
MFLEDVEPGTSFALGSHTFTAEAIVAFAQAYDPQPFHVDPDAAAKTHFGGLVASGWHTGAIYMRLNVETKERREAEWRAAGIPFGRSGPSPGFRDLAWRRPVRAGDTITYTTEIVEARRSATRPGWGLVTSRSRGVNQHGEEVFSLVSSHFLEARGPAAAD